MFTDAGVHVMLNALAAVISHLGLHTAIPNTSGSNEVSGGSPAYARVAATWAAAASRAVAISNTPTFNVPASTDVAAIGLWSASTGGTFYGSVPLNGGSLRGVGSVSDAATDTIRSNGHGLSNGMRVGVAAPIGESLQGGLSTTTLYYVVGATTDTFQLSLTSGGSAVDIALGELAWQRYIPETFAGQGTEQITSLSLSVA